MAEKKTKLIRIANIPESLNIFCKGLLKKLSVDYDVVALASPGDALHEIEEREGVRTIAIPIERRISIGKDIVSLFRMIRTFHKEKPTIVHTIGGKCGLLTVIAGWLCRVPIRIYSFTGLDSSTAKGFMHGVLWCTDKLSCMLATDLLPEGYGVKRDMERMKLTKKPLTVLGKGNIRGIDLEYYCTNNELQSQASEIRSKFGDCFVFLFVGRIVHDKGIDELVVAFKKINEQFPHTRLLIVGPDESQLDPISDESQKYIEESNVIYAAGAQSDVRPWYLAADCFILPSYREGVPNCVIEAGAMNLPSIVTDINGANEIIINGENGIIVPPQNSDALYEAMRAIMENEDDRLKMKNNARRMVAERYEQGYVQQCLMDYYKKTIDRLIK